MRLEDLLAAALMHHSFRLPHAYPSAYPLVYTRRKKPRNPAATGADEVGALVGDVGLTLSGVPPDIPRRARKPKPGRPKPPRGQTV